MTEQDSAKGADFRLQTEPQQDSAKGADFRLQTEPQQDSAKGALAQTVQDSAKMQSCEQQQHIRMDCILVDSKGSLLEVQRQRVATAASSGHVVIPESVFLGLVHALRHQRPDKRRFQLADMMTFFVPGIAAAAAASAKMQTLPPIPCDVVVPTTLPIFHGINRIWLIFREEVLVYSSLANKKPLAVSILKNGATKSNNKRVRISQELPRYKELRKPRKTIKIH